MATQELPPQEASVDYLKEKKEPSLGERNPLIYPPDLANPEVVEVLRRISNSQIETFGGVQPSLFDTATVYDFEVGENIPHLVVRFEVGSFTPAQLSELEELSRTTYGKYSKTTRTGSGSTIHANRYPKLETRSEQGKRARETGSSIGWTMGDYQGRADGGTRGVLVFRDVGNKDIADWCIKTQATDWFFHSPLTTPTQKEVKSSGYTVEVREALLYQTDMVELIAQVGSILAGKGIQRDPRLLYNIYNNLNRMGLKKRDIEAIRGMEDVIEDLDEQLIIPLANLGLSSGIDLHATSALLVGVPGTGKTLYAEYQLQQDNGVFFLPIDTFQLAAELAQPVEKRKIMQRISQVFSRTQIPIVLHIDDIEELAKSDLESNARLLNLMAGVRETGFYVVASTNHPDKIDPALIQPQRFGAVEYFGLPGPDVRRSILDAHVRRVSREDGNELFESDDERQLIIDALVDVTDSYTPRYLSEIANRAKARLARRIATSKDKRIGLTEKDIDLRFDREDWTNAFESVKRNYDRKAMKDWDKKIKEFTEKHRRNTGFALTTQTSTSELDSAIQKFAAMREGEAVNLNTPN